MKAEAIAHRCGGGGEVVYRKHDVVDAARDGVEPTAVGLGSQLGGCCVVALTRDLDAMRLGEEHAKELLGEVGVDASLNRLMTARGDDIADAVGLNDRRVESFFHGGYFATGGEAFGDDGNQRGIELIDART